MPSIDISFLQHDFSVSSSFIRSHGKKVMDQDQASAVAVAVIVVVIIFACWINHIREQSRRAGLYDLHDGDIV